MKKVIIEIGAYNKIFNDKKINDNTKVKVIFSLDSICEKCPNNENKNKNKCVTEEKVKELDLKVNNYFNIKEGIYCYNELEDMVFNTITEEIFDNICKNCSWYQSADCKSFIVEK